MSTYSQHRSGALRRWLAAGTAVGVWVLVVDCLDVAWAGSTGVYQTTPDSGPANTASPVGGGSIAIGINAQSSSPTSHGDSIAIGVDTAATNQDTIAIGAQTQATGVNSIALGNNTVDGSLIGTLASGDNSMAFGSDSTASGNGSITFGSNSLASGSGSSAFGWYSNAISDFGIALGAGSVANRDALNGASEAFSGTAVNSVFGALSVGQVGFERQITNVAGGTQDTDAVNVRQLRAVGNQLAGALGGGAGYDTSTDAYTAPVFTYAGQNYSTVAAAIASANALGVQYTPDGSGNATNAVDLTKGGALAPVSITGLAAATTSSGAVNLSQLPMQYSTSAAPTTANPATASNDVTLIGIGGQPVTLHDLAAGAIASSSTDAVNGSQVYGAVSSLATDLGGGTTVNSDGTLSAPTYTVKGTNYSNVGGAIGGLNSAITSLGALGVQYTPDGSGNATNAVDLTKGGALAPVSVTGLAAATTSSGAVNLSQLPMQYSTSAAPTTANPATASNDVTLIGIGGQPVALHDLAAGAIASSSTDAVNGSQVYGAVSSLATDLGGGTTVNSDGTLSAPTYTVKGTNYSNVGGAIGGLNSAITSLGALGVQYTPDGSGNATNAVDLTKGGALAPVSVTGLAAATTSSGAVNLSQLPMQYSTSAAPTTANPATASNDVTLIGIGGQPVTLHDLAAGAIASSSTDAVNGSQVYGAVSSLATDLGGGTTVNSDGTLSAPTYTVKGTNYSNVGGAIGGLNSAITSLGALGVQYTPNGSGNATNAIDLTKGGALAPVVVSGVAAGSLTSSSTDAVNGAQLDTTNQDLQSLRGSLSDGTIGLVQQDATSHDIDIGAATNGTAVDFGNSSGTARTLKGVAAGQIASGSLQAVNGSQVYGALSSLATNLGGGTSVNSDGTLSAPTFTVKGANYSNVAGAIGGLNSAVTSLDSLGVQYTPDGSGNATNAVDLTRGGALASVVVSGVAAGALTATSTDAVDGHQLYTTNQNLQSLRGSLSDGTIGLVQQDATSNDITVGGATNGTVVNFDNTSGTARTLEGVAAGQIAAGSTQGVDGGQVYGLAASIATNLGGGAVVESDGTLSAPTYTVKGTNYSNVGGAIGGLNSAVTSLGSLGVQYTPDGGGNATNAVDLTRGGALAPVAVSGVAAGALTATSTAAVNGAQLYATNQDVLSLRSTLTDGTFDLVQQDTTSHDITVGAGTNGTVVNFGNTTGTARTLKGVAAGQIAAASTQGVDGGQVYGVVASLATDFGGSTTVNSDGTLSAPTYTVKGTSYSNVGGAIGGLNSAVTSLGSLGVQYTPDGSGNPTNAVDLTRGGALAPVAVSGVAAGVLTATSTAAVNGAQLYATNQDVSSLRDSIANGTVGLMQQDPTSRTIHVGATTDGTTVDFANNSSTSRTLQGVANGQIATGSSQAVNGGQVYNIESSIAQNLGGGVTVKPDGTLSTPSYSVQGSTYSSVGGAIGGLDSAIDAVNTKGTRYVTVNSTGAAASAAGKDTVAIGPNATASADGGVALGANADATRSGMDGKAELFSGTGVASTEGAISVGATGAERQITNVAGGTQDTDAVNVRQLKAVGSQVASVLGGGAALNANGTLKAPSYSVDGTTYGTVGGAVAALDTTGVKYDIDPSTGGRGQSATLAGGDPDQPVLVRNVATGTAPTDAANTGQVLAAQAAASTYTDQQVAGVEQQIDGIDNRLAGLQSEITQSNREAHQGAAIGLAAASLRFDDRPGKLSAAIGGGYWKGEAATAMGFGYSLPDSSTRLNATATTTGTDFGIAAGASFTLN